MVGSFVQTLTYAVQAISSRVHGLTYARKQFLDPVAPLLTHTLPRPRGVSQVQNIHHFQRAPLTCCRTFDCFLQCAL